MNTAKRSIDFDKFILYLWWYVFNHHSHLDCSPFVYLHLHLLSHLVFIKKLFKVVIHWCFSWRVLPEKFISIALLLTIFILKIFSVLLLLSSQCLLLVKRCSHILLGIIVTTSWFLSLKDDSIGNHWNL